MLLPTDKTIEITTAGYCNVKCTKYCPHEVYARNYKGCKILTREVYQKMLHNVSSDTKIVFAGFSEPFISPDCVDMVKDTYNAGYPTSLSTTLNGVTIKQIIDLCDNVEFETLALHLPDPEHIANINVDQQYKDVFFYVVQHVPMVFFISMNGFFWSNNRENRNRDLVKPIKRFPIKCGKLTRGNPVILPNGDAVLCCHDFGLNYPLGNLLTTPLDDILNGQAINRIRRSNFNPFSTHALLCKRCTESFLYGPIPHKFKQWLNRKYQRGA
jgi:hypothetical protein